MKVTDEMVVEALLAHATSPPIVDLVTATHAMHMALAAALEARCGNASELVNSLIGWSNMLEIPSGKLVNEDCRAAAACIEDLAEALRMFAKLAACYDPPEDDDNFTVWDKHAYPKIGELRNARATLERWGLK